MTSKQVSEGLPDIPQATLYRHLKTLHSHGILEVVNQRSVNGIVELTYQLKAQSARFTREEFASIPAQDHQRYFAICLGALASTVTAYFGQPTYDTTSDGMTYFIANMSLTDERRRQLRLDLLELVQNYSGQAQPGARPTQLGVSLAPDVTQHTAL